MARKNYPMPPKQQGGPSQHPWQKGVVFATGLLLVGTPLLWNPFLVLPQSGERFYVIKDAFALSLIVFLVTLCALRAVWSGSVYGLRLAGGGTCQLPTVNRNLLVVWEASLLAFLALSFLTTLVSSVPSLSRLALVPVVLAVLFYFLLSRSLLPEHFRLLLLLQVHMGGVVGLHAWLQHLGWDPALWLIGLDPTIPTRGALLGQPVVVGGYLALSMSLGVAFFLSAISWRLRMSLAVVLILSLLGLLASGSRGGFLGAGIGIAALGLLLRKLRAKSLELRKELRAKSLELRVGGGGWTLSPRPLAVLALSLFLLLALLWLGVSRTPIYSRLAHSLTLAWEGRWDEAIGSRLYNWRLGLYMAADRPLLGHGLGSWIPTLAEYKIQYYELTPSIAQEEMYFHANNEFLQVWTEMGTPALLIVATGLIALLMYGLRFAVHGLRFPEACLEPDGRRSGSGQPSTVGGLPCRQIEYLGLVAGLVSIVFTASFSFFFHISSTTIPALLIAAALTAQGSELRAKGSELRAKGSEPSPRPLALLALSLSCPRPLAFFSPQLFMAARILLTGMVLTVSAYVLPEITAPFRASLVENRGDILLLKAESQDQRARRRSQIWEKPPLSEATERLYKAAARWYRQALEVYPQSIAALNGLGVCLVGLQRYQEAAEVFRRALTVLPTGEIYINLGIAYHHSGEHARAREAWEKGRKVK